MQVRLATARATNCAGKLFHVDGFEQLLDDFVFGRVGGHQQSIRAFIGTDLDFRLRICRRGHHDRTAVTVTHFADARIDGTRPCPFRDRFDAPLQAEHRADFVFRFQSVDVLQRVGRESDVRRSRAQRDQQVVNLLQIGANVRNADRARPLQSDNLSLRTNEFLGFLGSLFGGDVLDPEDDVHQLIFSALRQIRHLHFGNQIGRNRIVDVDDDQKLIATDEHIALLQQVAVDDIKSLFGHVLLLVEIVEGPRRDDVEVERQPSQFCERLEHVGPSRMLKVERDFFRLR